MFCAANMFLGFTRVYIGYCCVRPQAICAAACLAEHWPLLVVAPLAMLLTWLEQLRTWLPPQCCPDPANIVVITSGKASCAAAASCS